MPSGFYVQCRLRKKIGPDTYRYQVSWLPDRYAAQDKWLELKDKTTGEWEDHWQVVSTGTHETEKIVKGSERNYRDWRKHTDV
jgi:hypothetical protein